MKFSRKRKSIVAILLVAIMVFGGLTVYADTFLSPRPFEITSEDGTMVFRWNPGLEDNWTHGTAQAGVYRNDELIYSVKNLPIRGESASNFLFSKGFDYLVFRPSVCQVMALGFFENGVLLRSYRIDELVRDMNVVIYSVTTASWENWSGRNFDTANNTLTIVTRDDITYIFDITTGEIISDTAGDKLFIQNSFELMFGDRTTPPWAQDTPSSWAHESVERAVELGLLPEPFKFGFRKNTTRAEFTAITVTLYEHFNEPITGRITFTDTNDINVEKAAYIGLVGGVGNNHFDPYAPLTREQAAVMLARLADLLGIQLLNCSPTFADNEELSSWAFNQVGSIQATGIMSGVGDNRFAPQSPYTREQSIITIIKLYEMFVQTQR